MNLEVHMFFTKNKWVMDLVLSLAILVVGFEGGRMYESRAAQAGVATTGSANCGNVGDVVAAGLDTPWSELQEVSISDEVVPAWSYGPEDAALVVDVYLDLQCPYSQEYLRTVFPKLVQMAEDGELQLVIHDYPLPFHENAKPAAQATRCAAGLGQYQEYVMVLIEDPDAGNVEKAAREIGLDLDSLMACMQEQAEAVIEDFAAGEGAGITATPTTVINGRAIAGALPWEVFERLFKEAKDEK
jgi:protein-disulfide isomerase